MRAALLGLALLLLGAAPAAAAPRLVSVGTFSQPTYVASPPDESRVFVTEKQGHVRIAGGGEFLDVSSLTDGSGEERGLLSMAFAPNYATSGLFYVALTDRDTGDLRILEFQRSANPSRANPTPRRQLVRVEDNFEFHNGGQLQFGPDGMLYVSTGDDLDDPQVAQDTSSLLGKILRIDPRTGAAAAGNPHGLVWAWGLRNPWRFSFDRRTGDLVIGDVGADSREEVDWARAPQAGRALNFGWPCKEGTQDGPGTCSGTVTPPAFDYGRSGGCNAVVAGYVVRDPGLPTLNGRLLYGDLCHDTLRSIVLPHTGDRAEPLDVPALSSFGQDSCGHVYAASLNGPVYRIQDGAVSECTVNGKPVDVTAPVVTVRLRGVRKLLKTRRLRVTVRCDEACQVKVGTRLRNVRRLKPRRRALAAGQRAVFRLKLNEATARKLRKRVQRRGFVRIRVTVRATDAAGNVATALRRGRVRRTP